MASMSVSDSPLPASASGDIWHRNKAEIRELFQNQRKTLRQVKQLMELKGFPKKPLSTWETKVRDVLKLRKKAKAADWPLIYQQILPRLERPGQKGLKKRTAIYINDFEIPWDKAWKEIRRSRAVVLPSRRKTPRPLPSGIVIRTPSPIWGQSMPRIPNRAAQLTGEVVATRFEHMAQDSIPRQHYDSVATSQTNIGDDEWGPLAQKAVSVYQDCAATIPWVDLHQLLQALLQSAHAVSRLDGHIYEGATELSASITTNSVEQVRTHAPNIDFQSCFNLLPAGYPVIPHPSHDLGCKVTISAARFRLNKFISRALYLLSNDLHDFHDEDGGLDLFCSILERDSRQTISLLYRGLPSIRIAWRNLLRYSVKSQRSDTFRILVDIGIRNKWPSPQPVNRHLLHHAVEMDCYDTLNDLLTRGRSSGPDWPTQSLEAIITAICKGNDKCTRLLIEHCDFSSPTWWEGTTPGPLLDEFVCTMDIQKDGDNRALEFLLAIGANVDEPSSDWNISLMLCDARIDHIIDGRLGLTILDRSFYLNRPVYEKLAPYSNISASELSRIGILSALKNGKTALYDYMVARMSSKSSSCGKRVDSFLELVLAEQFMLLQSTNEGVDVGLVQGLVQYGIDLDLPSLGIGIQDLLGAGLRQVSRNCTDGVLELITILVAHRASIGGPQLRMAVQEHGATALECLALIVEDFPVKAVLALAEAARLNNFEAVEFLLRAGVDPSSFVSVEELEQERWKTSSHSVQAIAVGYYQDDMHVLSSSCAMMQFLAEHGAMLVVTPNDSSPLDFIHHLLMHSRSDTFRKVKYVIQALGGLGRFSFIPSYLLESCFSTLGNIPSEFEEERKGRLEMFKFFIDQGVSVGTGPCLSALIFSGGPDHLAEEIVRRGANLDAYYPRSIPIWSREQHRHTPLQAAAGKGNERLVRLLLGAGSNVNSRACGGEFSRTALQAICHWDTATEEEYERKLRICQLLISHGANPNGAPCRIWGRTALQEASVTGHLEVAALLLRNGARVNAPSCSPRGGFALDWAVWCGRLDTVKFFLNANALSSVRGTTGYDGAIRLAEYRSRMAIADLIREHAATNMSLGLINPELLRPQDDYRIYGYATNEDYYDPDFVGEECTVDSLCRNCIGRARNEGSRTTRRY